MKRSIPSTTSWRRVRIALAAAGAVAALAAAGASAASASTSCEYPGPGVCVSVADTPDPVSPSTTASDSYVAYDVTVTNTGKKTVKNAKLTDTLPAGTGFVSATPATCTAAYGTVTCALGPLAPGATTTVNIVLTAPSKAATIVDKATVSFAGDDDHHGHDGHGPGDDDDKPVSVSATETTTVQAIQGKASSLVPAGKQVRVDTDPTAADVTSPAQPNIGAATVPPQGAPLVATLEETPGAVNCPKGVVCRAGDWLHATVPGLFFPPLRFELHWDASIVSKKDTVKKFAVLHTDCLYGCPIEVISRRCSSANPLAYELPCLYGVREEGYGGFTATLVSKTNGYMR